MLRSPVRRSRHPPASFTCPGAGWLPCVLAALLGACATPTGPSTDRLDPETGTTLMRLPKPIELLATLHRATDGADPFAFFAPFITDRMGALSYFIWISSPNDTPIEAGPELYCDGSAVALGPPAAQPPSELSGRPYEQPAPWSSDAYFEVDARALRALAGCHRIAVALRYANEGDVRFEAGSGPVLLAFLARTGVG